MTLGPLLMVTPLNSGLVLPPPVRPGQDRSYRAGWPPEEPPEQTYTPGTVSSNPLLPQSLVALAPLFLLQFLVTVLRPNSRKMQKAVDNEMILLRWRLLAPSACCIVTLADRPLTPCGLLVALPGCESPVQCGFGDFEGSANFRDRVSLLVEILGNTELFASEGFGSTALASSGSGCHKTCCCSFPDQVSLKLS